MHELIENTAEEHYCFLALLLEEQTNYVGNPRNARF